LNQKINSIPPIKVNNTIIHYTRGIELGWGKLSGKNTQSLKQIEIPIVKNDYCISAFEDKFQKNIHICGGYPDCTSVLPCIGDTGDPFVIKHQDEFLLEGISEFHINCEKKAGVGSWIRISNLIPWLKEYVYDLELKRKDSSTPSSTLISPSIPSTLSSTPLIPSSLLRPSSTKQRHSSSRINTVENFTIQVDSKYDIKQVILLVLITSFIIMIGVLLCIM